MFRNVTIITSFTLLLVSGICTGQKTWWGEYSVFAGGGINDIFRFEEAEGAGSVNGTGMWTGGFNLRRLFGDHFSIETGLTYVHQYYYTSPAPGIGGEDRPGDFGVIAVPLTARVDFLKWFFADAGALFALQPGVSDVTNMSGIGVTLGTGFQYNFKSDMFIRVRAYGSQYGLLHLIPEDHPQMLINSGVTLGVGYRFVHLGKCNCPADNMPRRRIY